MSSIELQDWRRISEHLDHVLELTDPQCEGYLVALERDDPGIASQVRSLLSARQEHRYPEFLAGAAPGGAEPATASTLGGRAVGPYVIDAEIGQGGMGSVWHARRADGRFEGEVAIKFIHPAWLGRAGEQRFRLEGRVLARLDHPNIARLLDAGVLDGTQPYLVLEYVEGEPIDLFCDRHSLGLDARIRLFIGVLAAVAHAHSHLIVHRDLKPSNVFVTRQGAVKLLDFGIAKLLNEEGDRAALTQASAYALTPEFAAPEQVRGEAVTTATDVYALGLLLYVLLTGAHPFSRGSRSGADLYRAILTEDPPRASVAAAGLAHRRRLLEGDIDNILAKALKKDPADRYASVGAFADDLQRFLAQEPVMARPDTVAYRVSKFVRRNRGTVVGAVLIALGLIGTSAFALFQLVEARAQRDLAVAEARRANAQSDLTEFLVGDTLSHAPQDAVRQRLDRARQFIAARFRRDPLVAGRLLVDVSGRYIDIGDHRTAADVIQEAQAIGRRADDPEFNAELACIRAEDMALAHDLPAAGVQLQTGLANMRRLPSVPPGLTAECAFAVAFVAQADGDFSRAVASLRHATEGLERAGLYGTSRYTSTSNELARALLRTGDFREAWRIESRNISLLHEMGRADTSGYFAMVAVGCSALRGGGQPRRALELVNSIVAEARRSAPDFQPPYFLDGCLALDEIAVGRAQDASAILARASAAAEKAGALYQVANYQASSVTMAIAQGDLVAADAGWAVLAPQEDKALTAKDRGIDTVRLILLHARLDLAHRRLADALRRLDAAAALVAARHQPANPDARELELLRAQAMMAPSTYLQAAEHARNAVELARAGAVDPKSSAWIGEALVWRARSEAALGKMASAAASAKEALMQLDPNVDSAHPLIAAARELIARGS
jgi:serine/threonine protein kinase